MRELAKSHTADAIDRLVHWMKSDNAKASVAAANALLDRAHGKPAQTVTGEGGGPLIVQIVKFTDAAPK